MILPFCGRIKYDCVIIEIVLLILLVLMSACASPKNQRQDIYTLHGKTYYAYGETKVEELISRGTKRMFLFAFSLRKGIDQQIRSNEQ